MYCVDYVKEVIKNKDAKFQEKFNALLFLKELLKSNNNKIIIYNEKKLLERLFKLATDRKKENVL